MSGESEVLYESYDLRGLLGSKGRDFLIRNNGDKVGIDQLQGKVIGLYFSASWCGPCKRFTPKLAEVYRDLLCKGNFEVVFISGDEEQESFDGYFSAMPWLAVPFSDSEKRSILDQLFDVAGIPHLVIIGAHGTVITSDAVSDVREYGAEAYPFSGSRIQQLRDELEVARNEQTLEKILVHPSRDFLIYNDGKKVLVSELVGKTVGLLFFASFGPCKEIVPKLIDTYNKIREDGQFEIVFISLDVDAESFDENFKAMPWLALPFNDKSSIKLPRYFEIPGLPTLTILGPDGKTIHPDVVEIIEEHGALAYPFTHERLKELEELEKPKLQAQTLESLLVSHDRNFVINNAGEKIPVSELVGKTTLLYFSAHWCPPCRAFTPKLIKTYHEIKAKHPEFEVIFISNDHDQNEFEEYFGSMPFLALPFRDHKTSELSGIFKIRGIPCLVTIGPDGKTIRTDTRNLVDLHGATAYPFTEQRLEEVELELEESTRNLPKEVKHALHEAHTLRLSRRSSYVCDGCEEGGQGCSYVCLECDFDLHPDCALGMKEEIDDAGDDHEGGEEKPAGEGWVCEGDVCHKA